MKEIKCPHCEQVFQIDDSDYNALLNSIKNKEYQEDLSIREEAIKANYLNNIKEANLKSQNEINRLRQEKENLEKIQQDKIALAVQSAKEENNKELNALKQKILELENQSRVNELENKNKVNEALNEKNKQINELSNKIELLNAKNESEINSLKVQFDNRLKEKDEQISYYKDLKTKLSTKLVGETLEQHCLNEFNRIRTSLFPYAEFGKDNLVSKESGSKGDFIFRDFDNGNEYISIMFEMKNENDFTATKHKNSDFFKELNKDREEKHCEYAVLVSMLEPDNDFYNAGIVDVSYEYPKMYVIRPQCFISMITLLVNAAKNSIQYQRQLVELKAQNIDIVNFEDSLNAYKAGFTNNVRIASEKFENAISEIDKTIDHLQKVKEGLIGSGRQLRIADDKINDITIRKLTKNSPSLINEFNNIKKNK